MKVGPSDDSWLKDQGADVPSSVTSIEDSLVQSCAAGDSSAWRSLHRRYYPVAVAFLRKLGARENEIEEACQDVFAELIRYLPSLRGQTDLKIWLYRLCVTQTRRVRSRSRILRVIRERMQSDLAPDPMVPAATMMESTVLKRVHSTLDRMSEGCRLVFVLYEFEGLPGKQIAAITECPEVTVWRRLHRARRIFRDTLGLSEPEAVGNE